MSCPSAGAKVRACKTSSRVFTMNSSPCFRTGMLPCFSQPRDTRKRCWQGRVSSTEIDRLCRELCRERRATKHSVHWCYRPWSRGMCNEFISHKSRPQTGHAAIQCQVEGLSAKHLLTEGATRQPRTSCISQPRGVSNQICSTKQPAICVQPVSKSCSGGGLS